MTDPCSMEELGHDDGVARLQLDVLLQTLSRRGIFVIERVTDRPAVFASNDHNLLAVGVLLESAGQGEQLQDVDWTGESVGTRFGHLSGDEHFSTVDLLDDNRDAWILDVPLR